MNSGRTPLFAVSNEEGCWPTGIQELLLKATLLKGEEALNAWNEWRAKADIDLIDAGSLRLLPLLHENLKAHGVADPLMERFKGVHRLYWYRNQMLLRTMAGVLKEFQDAGIRTMVLKGAALIQQYYEDYGSRPMSDFDVLVPDAHVLRGVEILRSLGWTSYPEAQTTFSKDSCAVRSACHFVDADGRELDLHWRLLNECRYKGADDDFWNETISTNIFGINTCILCPTDQFLYLIIRGPKWEYPSPLRWIADAMMIIDISLPQIDWKRLINQARKRHLIIPVRRSLNYLQRVLNAPIPADVLKDARSASVSKRESTEFQLRTRLPGLRTYLLRYWYAYLRYSRGIGSGQQCYKRIHFLRYLQYFWGLEHEWQVPIHAASSIIKVVRRKLKPATNKK